MKLSPAFSDEKSGLLLFSSSISHVTFWRVTSFNVVSFTGSFSSELLAGSTADGSDFSASADSSVLSFAGPAVSSASAFTEFSASSSFVSTKRSSLCVALGSTLSLLVLFLSTRAVSSTKTCKACGNITADMSSPCLIVCSFMLS